MKTIADSRVLGSLVERLRSVRPHSARRWGTLTPHEMLCHLGDATDMVLRTRPRTHPLPMRRRPIMRLFWLWLPVPFPRGVKTSPHHDSRAKGTRPSDYARDLARSISGLEGIAAAGPDSLEPMHGIFGVMTVRDWQRWAWRHTDYHLRQFGA